MEFFPPKMPQPSAPTQSPPNGTRVRLPVDANLAVVPNQPMGLITARNLQWGPWAVTLDPIAFGNQNALYQLTSPVGEIPHSEYVGYPANGLPLVTLSWGVAGILRTVCFDYPVAGGAFVVNANAVELSVACRQTTAPYADAAHVPSVGAWITPSAAPASRTAMTLFAGTDIVGGTHTVPPFAKDLIVSAYRTDGEFIVNEEMQVIFYGEGLVPLFYFGMRIGAGIGPEWMRIPVPAGAIAVSALPNVPNAFLVSALWEITFA